MGAGGGLVRGDLEGGPVGPYARISRCVGVELPSVPFVYSPCKVVDNPMCMIVRANSLVSQTQKDIVAQENPQTSVKSDKGSLSSNHDCDASGMNVSKSLPNRCST